MSSTLGFAQRDYMVKKGDTLSEIASKFELNIQKLTKNNKLKDPDKIYAGQTLLIDNFEKINADMETDAVKSGKDAADDPAIWINASNSEKSRIIGTNKDEGIIVYDLHGKELYSYPVGEMNNIDVRYNFPLGGKIVDLVAGTNRSTNSIDIFTIDKNTGELTNATEKTISCEMPEVYGFTLYHSQITGRLYGMVVGKDGSFEQHVLFDNGNGKIEAKLERTFAVGGQSEGMVVDDENAALYIGEENVGIWKYDAESIGGTKRKMIDTVWSGHMTADIEGLTMYYGKNNTGYLMASSQGDNSYAIYDRIENNYIGSFQLTDGDSVDGTSDTDGIDVSSYSFGDIYPNGFFIAQDGENTNGNIKLKQNFKVVAWDKIAEKFNLMIDTSQNPRGANIVSKKIALNKTLAYKEYNVTADFETEAEQSGENSVYSPCVWINKNNPENSLIIGSNEEGKGLKIYNLDGKEVNSIDWNGELSNLDIRYGMKIDGKTIDIIAVTNVSKNSIELFGIDPATADIKYMNSKDIILDGAEISGIALYNSKEDNKFYVLAIDENGKVSAYELLDDMAGKIKVSYLDSFEVNGECEGMVIDDETGDLYLAEEESALWRFSAAENYEEKFLIDDLNTGHLEADIEGLTIYRDGQNSYLMASSEGSSSYAMYRLDSDNTYLGNVVIEEGSIDGTVESGGIFAESTYLGSKYPKGVFIANDDNNVDNGVNMNQNFKVVSWEKIENELKK